MPTSNYVVWLTSTHFVTNAWWCFTTEKLRIKIFFSVKHYVCVWVSLKKNQAHTHITFTSNLVVTHTLCQPPEWKNPVGFLQTYTEVQHFPSQAECGLFCETLLYPFYWNRDFLPLSLYVLQLNSILVSSGSAHLAPDKALLAIWALCCVAARISSV